VSSPEPDVASLDRLQALTWELAINALEKLLAGTVVGVIAVDEAGMFVTPRPNCAPRLFEDLAKADFKSMARIAQEWQK
jgi:hypothetical protein